MVVLPPHYTRERMTLPLLHPSYLRRVSILPPLKSPIIPLRSRRQCILSLLPPH